MEVAKRIWVNLLRNRPPRVIPREDIKEAIALVKQILDLHGRSCNETRDIRALVAETNEKERQQIEHAEVQAMLSGGSEAKLELALCQARIPRLRTETIVKHVRALNKPGKMLMKLEKIDQNPFERHIFSNQMIEAMRHKEEERAPPLGRPAPQVLRNAGLPRDDG